MFVLGRPADPGPAVAPSPRDEPAPERPGLIQTVGLGVKPISGSARHAFSFLLGPPVGEPGPTGGDGF